MIARIMYRDTFILFQQCHQHDGKNYTKYPPMATHLSTSVAPFLWSFTLASSESRVLSHLLALLLLLACVLLMLDWLLLSPEGGLSHPFGRHWDMAAGHYTPLSPFAPVTCSDSLPVNFPNNQGESNNLHYPLPRPLWHISIVRQTH